MLWLEIERLLTNTIEHGVRERGAADFAMQRISRSKIRMKKAGDHHEPAAICPLPCIARIAIRPAALAKY